MPTKTSPLLFISPVMPDPSGGGTAQRGFHFLRLLRERHRVDLMITGDLGSLPDPTARLVEQVFHLYRSPLRDLTFAASMLRHTLAERGLIPHPATPEGWYQVTPHRLRQARRIIACGGYRVIHAFRLSSAPFAVSGHSGSPACRLQLDLDEVESHLLGRIGRLQKESGDTRSASRTLNASEFLKHQENLFLPRFDRLFVSSPAEKTHLAETADANSIRIAPNIVLPRNTGSTQKTRDSKHRLLFVGSFGYYPNRDAVAYFLTEVAPLIRRTAKFELVCVGYGLRGEFRDWLRQQPDVAAIGETDELSTWYRTADAAIVPLRAGGGTRIKILEAFAFGCPVVSTPLGAEGLRVVDGRELLLAESATDFARQCLRIFREPDLGQSLAEHAERVLRDDYSEEVLRQAIHG